MKLVTWNVLMAPTELRRRTLALGEEVCRQDPDAVALQEVTADSREIFESLPWWRDAQSIPLRGSSPYFTMLYARGGFEWVERAPFVNSRMGRELVYGRLAAAPLVVASSHLESLAENTVTRTRQLEEALHVLSDCPPAVLMGDLNLITGIDPEPVLQAGWIDAWYALDRPHSTGLTYDGRRNPLASRHRSRLDRAYCLLGKKFQVRSADLLGLDEIEPGLTCSDHFGLCVELAAM